MKIKNKNKIINEIFTYKIENMSVGAWENFISLSCYDTQKL